MSKRIFIKLIAILLLLTLTACSAKEYKPLTKDSSPSLNNSLVVMGIKWIETYSDLEIKENKSFTSFELLNDAKLILKKQIEKGKPELYRALYYLSDFKFQLTDEDGKHHQIVRFGKNMLQYENVALYEFKPGIYTLNGFKMNQLQLEEDRRGKGEVRWKLVNEEYKEKIGPWKLTKGEILYLGDLTLYFKTKKIERGILSPEIVNKSIKLEKIDLKDNFEQMKLAIQEQKPWFPVEKLVNISVENEWIYFIPEIEKKKTEEAESQEKEKKKAKKKSDNSFY